MFYWVLNSLCCWLKDFSKTFDVLRKCLNCIIVLFLPNYTLCEMCPNTGFFSGPYFPVFSPSAGKYGSEKTPYLDTFHAVIVSKTLNWEQILILLFDSSIVPVVLVQGNAILGPNYHGYNVLTSSDYFMSSFKFW